MWKNTFSIAIYDFWICSNSHTLFSLKFISTIIKDLPTYLLTYLPICTYKVALCEIWKSNFMYFSVNYPHVGVFPYSVIKSILFLFFKRMWNSILIYSDKYYSIEWE